MTILSKTKSHSDTVDYFKEKPVKRLKNIDGLAEQLTVIKTNDAFKGYAISNKLEMVERKYPIAQLDASKLSIKNLFSDLLNETKGFKFQITVESLLKKIQAQWRN